MYKLTLKHHFDAAHYLYDYEGKCANMHGHRWEVLVEISVDKLINDMVIDFTEIKRIIDKFDHSVVNDHQAFATTSPTAENIAKYLHSEILNKIKQTCTLEVTVWESPNASVSYNGGTIL